MGSQPELLLQKAIIDRTIEEGGHGFKLANKFLSGVPDLLLRPKGCGIFVAEAKYIGDIDAGRTYKVPTTPLQRDTLKKIQQPELDEPVTCVLVGYRIGKSRYLAICPSHTLEIRHAEFPTTGTDHNHSYKMSSLWESYRRGWKLYAKH